MDLLADEPLDLAKIRYALIRQEDTIIFKLIERAQFPHNAPIYLPSSGAAPASASPAPTPASASPDAPVTGAKAPAVGADAKETTTAGVSDRVRAAVASDDTASEKATTIADANGESRRADGLNTRSANGSVSVGGGGGGGVSIPGWPGSFLDFVMHRSESAHALVRRYESPDELPFSPPASLPAPILPPLAYPPLIRDPQKRVNVNGQIKRFYIDHIVPALSKAATAARPAQAHAQAQSHGTGAGEGAGDVRRENYGSAAVCDVEALQALSRRIHYGKFVAEVKFQQDRAAMTALIEARDTAGLEASITNAAVEKQVLARLERKARAYGRDIQDTSTEAAGADREAASKVDVATVVAMYRDYVIPLTKVVEVEYLLQRLEYE